MLYWNPSTSPGVVRYNAYYGGATQSYTNMVGVGDVTNATISGLLPGAKYFFAVTAVDTVGVESAFSNELSYQFPGGLVVSAANQSRTYGAANPTLTGTVTGLRNGDNITATFSTAATAGSPVGTYSIVPSLIDPGGKLANYTVTINNGVLTVSPAPLTIAAASASKLYGAALPALTASYAGFVNGDTASSLISPPALSTTATAASPVGSYPITAGGAAGANYTFIYIPGTLVVTKASTAGVLSSSGNPSLPRQAVTFRLALGAVAPGAETPTGTVQFEVDGAAAGAPVSLSGGAASFTTTNLAHGSHTVAGQYPGDGNFLGLTSLLSSSQVIDTPPVAGAATLYRGLAGGVQVTVSDLLTNVSDADGDARTLVGVSATSANGGTVATNSGWIFYTPVPGFTNTDTFTYLVSDGWSAPVAGTVTVDLALGTEPSRNLAITPLGNGSVAIGGQGIPGRTYILQYTTNTLPTTSWLTLGPVTADGSGAFGLVDTNVAGLQFYRAIYP